MRFLVLGAGATGGYFGGRLAEAGRDVTFLVRPRRAELLATHGLHVVGHDRTFAIEPRVVTADAIEGPYDAVLFTAKAYGLEAAIDDVAPAVGPDTMILPVLNGMRHLDLLDERFGRHAVLGGVCMVATTLDETGRIVQLADMQELIFGDRDEPGAARVTALVEQLQGAGFAARASDRIVQEMWEKWVFLGSLGAVTCLMRGSVGQVAAAPGGVRFAEDLLAESAAVAAAEGSPVPAGMLEGMTARLTETASPLASSMFRDLQAGRPVEVDHILGDLVRRAGVHGIAVPLLAAATTHLDVYQQALEARA